jgi:hypothetical protein
MADAVRAQNGWYQRRAIGPAVDASSLACREGSFRQHWVPLSKMNGAFWMASSTVDRPNGYEKVLIPLVCGMDMPTGAI